MSEETKNRIASKRHTAAHGDFIGRVECPERFSSGSLNSLCLVVS
jgi:hypothetical protein